MGIVGADEESITLYHPLRFATVHGSPFLFVFGARQTFSVNRAEIGIRVDPTLWDILAWSGVRNHEKMLSVWLSQQAQSGNDRIVMKGFANWLIRCTVCLGVGRNANMFMTWMQIQCIGDCICKRHAIKNGVIQARNLYCTLHLMKFIM